jgi:hypothetical protein
MAFPLHQFKNLSQYERYYLIFYVGHVQFKGDVAATANFMGISNNTCKTAFAFVANPSLQIKKGAIPMITTRHDLYIEARTACDRHLTDLQLAKEICSNFPEISHCSANTILNARHRLGLKYRPPRKTVDIPESARNKCIAWCQKNIANHTNLENVIFSDESWFETGSDRRWIWRHKYDTGPSVSLAKKAHPEKVMIWGAIGKNFKSKLKFIEGSVTAESYCSEILTVTEFRLDADKIYGVDKWVFQQDNAPSHIALNVIQSLDFIDQAFIEDWPPYSPDLNISEMVWAIMKKESIVFLTRL